MSDRTINRNPSGYSHSGLIRWALAGFVSFALLAAGLKLGWWNSMDNRVTEAMPGFRMEWLTPLLKLLSELGSTAAFAVFFLVAAGILLYRRRFKETAALFVSVAGSYGLNTLLKNVFARERPALDHLIEADGFSFPSGNAMVAASFYGMIALLMLLSSPGPRSRAAAWLVIVLLLLIGFSRVYLNVHYPTDIVAGYAAGAGWMLLSSLIVVRRKPAG